MDIPAKQREAAIRAHRNGGRVKAHPATADALERRGLAFARYLTDAGRAFVAQYL